jgi:tight adherence protein B
MNFFGMGRSIYVAFIFKTGNMTLGSLNSAIFNSAILNSGSIALVAATLCALGVYLIISNTKVESLKKSDFEPSHWRSSMRIKTHSRNLNSLAKKISLIVVTIFAAYIVIELLTKSPSISFSIAILATAIPFMVNRNRENQRIRNRDLAWPEAIDSLVSALQSGIPIPEAVMSLSKRGPVSLQPMFHRIEDNIKSGGDFHEVLLYEKNKLNSAISDQVFETLILAKDFGGKDSNTALRLLAEFVREDLAILEEIRTKFGWVKNSAVLATAAPWILLVLLSTQSSTREAFATLEGLKILSLGILMTAGAYIWMEKVGALPTAARALR